MGEFHEAPLTIEGDDGPRTIRVFTPEDLKPGEARPVLYLFDGQNVFGDEGSYSGGWQAHVAVEELPRASNGRPVMRPIVVGIPHGGEKRLSELSAWPISPTGEKAPKEKMFPAGAEAFVGWVIGTVMPAVRARFAIPETPLAAVVGGSSMGGLASIWAHFRHPEVFGGALAMSPSLWVAQRAIFPYLEHRPTPQFSRIYLDCGALEGRGRMIGLARDLATKLEQRGYDDDRLLFVPDPRGTHEEAAWARRLPRALRFMFRQ
jgi:predicted alpha/beta superfamily hydrolase